MILVTGGTGTVGRELLRLLSEREIQVRALTRYPNQFAVDTRTNIHVVGGDLTQPETLKPLFQDVTKVFLLSPNAPDQVEIETGLIREAQQAKVEHIVKMSVLGADPSSPVAILRWHGQIEQELKRSGVSHDNLRSNAFMQNLLRMRSQITEGGRFYGAAEAGKVSWVDTRDIAAVATATLTQGSHGGKSYDITGSEALSNEDVATTLSEAIGRRVTYIDESTEGFIHRLVSSGTEQWLARALAELERYYREGNGGKLTNVVTKVAGQPPITLNQFALDFASAFKGERGAGGAPAPFLPIVR